MLQPRFSLCYLLLAAPAMAQDPATSVRGVRQLKAYRLDNMTSAVAVNATEDGLVEFTVHARNVSRAYYPIESAGFREFYDPDAVLLWADSVQMLGRWLLSSRAGERSPMTPALGDYAGRRYVASGVNTSGQLDASLTLEDCGRGSMGATIRPGEMLATVELFRRAALDARAVQVAAQPPRRDDDPYWEHAVGCPAQLQGDVEAPEYPASIPVTQRRPYQVLASVVVERDGTVSPASLKLAPGTDPRFAEATRASVPGWRFTISRRGGAPVRQVAHVTINFRPPVTLWEPSLVCQDAIYGGVMVKPVAINGTIPAGVPRGFYLTVAMRFASHPVGDALRGRRLRFRYSRNEWASMIRLYPDTAGPLDPMMVRTIESLSAAIGALPETMTDDVIELEVSFGASECRNPLSIPMRVSVASIVPQPDGTIMVSNVDESGSAFVMAEPLTRHDFVSPEALRFWVDTTEKLLATIDTAAWRTGRDAPDFVPNAPALGHPMGRGLRLSLTGYGIVRGGLVCFPIEGGLEVMPEEFGRFAAAAREALRLLPRLQGKAPPPLERGAYQEHDIGCPPGIARESPMPEYPEMGNVPRSSTELMVRFVVDTAGRVDTTTVAALAGTDPRLVAAVRRVVPAWRFSAALRGGRKVRAWVHMPLVLRPRERDAAILARQPAVRQVEDTLRRTVFYKPNAPADRPQGGDANFWTQATTAMQPLVLRARATWPAARERFRQGLPRGTELFVTVRLTDASRRMEQAFVRVEAVGNGRVMGRIQSTVQTVAGYQRGDVYAISESELIDWTIVGPDGSEEGNIVGKFLETWRPRP